MIAVKTGENFMKKGNPTSEFEVVFIHSLFRSGSTYFYHALKRTGQAHVYHEPFHEVIGNLPSAWKDLAGRIGDFKKTYRHDFLKGSYFDEYAHLLPTIKKTFDASISFELFFLDSQYDSPVLKTYIDSLISGSPLCPVLQCTRSIGRVEWLKSNYASKHIFLLRNPWDQWYSYKVDNHISASPQLIYSQPRLPKVLEKIMEACEFTPLRGSDISSQLHYCSSHPVTPEADYFLFFGLWLYAFFVAKAECDLVIDMDCISREQSGREEAEKFLLEIGLKGIDLNDCKLHQSLYKQDELDFYKHIEGQGSFSTTQPIQLIVDEAGHVIKIEGSMSMAGTYTKFAKFKNMHE